MKTGFNIPPSEEKAAESQLLLEIRDNGICLMWFQKQPFIVTGYAVYLLEPYETLANGLYWLKTELKLNLLPPNSISIIYNTRYSAYLPASLADKKESYAAILQLIWGVAPGELVFTSVFEQTSITQLFRIPEEVKILADSFCPMHQPEHVHANFAVHLTGSDLLYCHVFYDNISVMLKKKDVWQIFQQFSYETPEDISYHLIHLLEQHGMKAADTPLLLSGMITVESNLYQQLYNFFLNLSFMPLPENVGVSTHLNESPIHFITPLTYLAKCVS